MNLKEGDVQRSKIYSSEKNRTTQTTQKNKNIPFYRKSFLKNNKSYYYHKKGNNSNITPNNKSSLISGYKKPQRILNIGTEDTNQSTKGKSLICSKSKSNYDEITPEKYILNNKSISPFSIHSIENSKDKKFINLNDKIKKPCIVKKNYKRKRENLSLNYPSKIHNISINNEEIKRNLKYDESLSNNSSKSKSKKYNFKPNKMKIFHNKEKKTINISYKSNKSKEPIDILSHNIVQNIQNSLNKYNNYNNTNTIIINNTIKRNNSNFLRPSKTNNAQLKINNNVFDINNIQTETTKRNLVKGKIIKFKYNGTEFFFEPIHNKTDNFFYKENTSYTKKDLINAANRIKKWWRQITLLNILMIKNKVKSGINLINEIYINRIFRLIKYKILYLNEIIYIQKKWREFSYLKSKKEKTSVYRKNENYLYDNSYRKKYDNLYMNMNLSENTKSNEDISGYNFKNRIYYKNNKLKKKAKYLNNFFLSNLSSSKLLSPKNNTNENIPIKKLANKKICFYSKYNKENITNKIIFIQRKIKAFLKFKYYCFIKKIYNEIYLNKISSYQNDINEKIKKEKNKSNLNISNNSFCIIPNKKEKPKQFNIIKTEEIIFNETISYQKYKSQNLKVNKNSQLIYKPLKIKKKDKYTIFNNPSISIYSKKNEIFATKINEINFSMFKPNEIKQDLNKIINKPIINNHCFYQKISIPKKYINSLICLQQAFKKRQTIKKLSTNKIVHKKICLITKLYKIKKNKYQNATKIQNIFELSFMPNNKIFSKPITKLNYITKTIKKFPKLKRFYKLQKNNSFKTISQNDSNKNQLYFNNIDEFLQDKEGEKINDITKYNTINNSHRKLGERNSNNILNDTDEKKNENPIKIMNAQIHKSSINCNINNIKNLKTVKNNYIPNNSIKYVNIESLPSINSLKTNTENDLFSNIESNKLISNNNILNNITSVSIQTLTSNLSKNKFRENIKFIKKMTTEGNNIKKHPLEFENDKNYFYTDNNIVKFSFNNGEGIILGTSTEKRNTKNYFNLIRFINIRKIKIFCYKLIQFKNVKCFYIFFQMVFNRIKKSINAFVFNNIFGRNTKNEFYKIIHKHISIYNKITKDINIKAKYKNNELILLIKSNIFKKYLNNKFLFLSDEQEKNLIQKDIFISNDKDLINYFLLYYKYENKSLDNNYFNMIQFRLIKEPLYNMNIFAITKYMDVLYNNIIHKNICKNCFCKNGESCSINCNCHIKQQNSINLINKIKNRITHYKSSNDSNNNKDNNSFLEEKNKINDRNIKITIKKVKRGNALDTTKTRYDNSEQSSDSKNSNSNDLDIFQKLNTGVQSIINKVKINKAFKDFSLNKKKIMDRTCTEINGIKNQTKSYNEGLYNVKKHFTTPDKRSCSSFIIEKKLFNEK